MKRKIKAASALTLVYDIDTQGGERFVVGIHNYGRASGNSATRVTPAVIANFLKWGALGATPGTKPPSASAKAGQPQPDDPAMAAAGLTGEEIDG